MNDEPLLKSANAFNFLAETLAMAMDLAIVELPFTVTTYLADGRIVTITIIEADHVDISTL